MRLQYGAYHSSTPASFLRTNPDLFPSAVKLQSQSQSRRFRTPRPKPSYKSHEYFTIVLGPQIAPATHTATLELELESCSASTTTNAVTATVTHNDVIVKLGFSPEEKERLHREYRVYERLARRGVRGVPHVFGLFQDLARDGLGDVPLALVLADDGEAVSRRDDPRLARGELEGKVGVSSAEK
jgi:hypothetical protein